MVLAHSGSITIYVVDYRPGGFLDAGNTLVNNTGPELMSLNFNWERNTRNRNWGWNEIHISKVSCYFFHQKSALLLPAAFHGLLKTPSVLRSTRICEQFALALSQSPSHAAKEPEPFIKILKLLIALQSLTCYYLSTCKWNPSELVASPTPILAGLTHLMRYSAHVYNSLVKRQFT